MAGWDNRSDFPPIFMTLIPGPSPNYEWFPWSICNGCGRESLSFRTPGSVPLFGTCLCSNWWYQFYRTCHIFFSTFLLEYPLVFSRFWSLHLWNRLTEVNETWQRAKSQHSLPSLFFEPVEKRRWPPQLLIGWDILDLSFETTEQKSTKLERKQDRNVHYQVCCWPVLNFLWQWRETVSKVWDTGVIIICCLDQYRWH